jgi:hypothetical protein
MTASGGAAGDCAAKSRKREITIPEIKLYRCEPAVQICANALSLVAVLIVVPRREIELVRLREQRWRSKTAAMATFFMDYGFPKCVTIMRGIAATAATVINTRNAIPVIVNTCYLRVFP